MVAVSLRQQGTRSFSVFVVALCKRNNENNKIAKIPLCRRLKWHSQKAAKAEVSMEILACPDS
jgi:hypothetical protein